MAIANMLVYLQVVLLFQEKTGRVYWQLLVLSLLQVVVAAALNLGPQFGLLLASIRAARAGAARAAVHASRTATDPAVRRADRRPLDDLAERCSRRLPSLCAGAPAAELTAALGGWRVVRQVALLASATLLFAAVFFYATPRLNDSSWQGSAAAAARRSGFAGEVRLERVGPHPPQQSGRACGSLLTRLNDRQPVSWSASPIFTGSTLTDYSSRGRRQPLGRGARPPRPSGTTARAARRQPASAGDIRGQRCSCGRTSCSKSAARRPIRQSCRRSGSTIRRSTSPIAACSIERGAACARRRASARAVSLRVRHSGDPRAAGSCTRSPHPNPVATADRCRAGRPACSSTPARFPQLADTAARVLASKIARRAAPARSGPWPWSSTFARRSLSLFAQPRLASANHDLDPIEDFVANHRTGHCEYFASALVLMLRSQGIPARMIIGYKGGEFNSLGHYYVVQQRHAHAWVEAWMPPGEVPDGKSPACPRRRRLVSARPHAGAGESARGRRRRALGRRVVAGVRLCRAAVARLCAQPEHEPAGRAVYRAADGAGHGRCRLARGRARAALAAANGRRRLGIDMPPPTRPCVPRAFEGSAGRGHRRRLCCSR